MQRVIKQKQHRKKRQQQVREQIRTKIVNKPINETPDETELAWRAEFDAKIKEIIPEGLLPFINLAADKENYLWKLYPDLSANVTAVHYAKNTMERLSKTLSPEQRASFDTMNRSKDIGDLNLSSEKSTSTSPLKPSIKITPKNPKNPEPQDSIGIPEHMSQ